MEDFANRYRGPMTVVLIVLAAAGVIVWLLRRPEPRPVEVVMTPSAGEPRERSLKVYVSGEVVAPGVYALRGGDRVEDALAAAGGMTDQADRGRINLALRVQDQQQINVPAVAPGKAGAAQIQGDRVSRSVAPSDTAKVNLNTATAAELDALPGIGPVTIQKILGYREQTGNFTSIDELKSAKIVSNAQFEQIKDLITAP